MGHFCGGGRALLDSRGGWSTMRKTAGRILMQKCYGNRRDETNREVRQSKKGSSQQ